VTWRFGPAPVVVAGPCVLEDGDGPLRVAEVLARIGMDFGIPVCFKASWDKANRSRADSPRGPGLEEGLRRLESIRRESGLPVLTDVHEPAQVPVVAAVVDALQIPAFLCRQTDLLLAAGRTGLPVNVKKGQWMSPEAMSGAVAKVRQGISRDLAVTERGTFFGYGDLVVDMRNFARLREATDAVVLFDATHSVQRPGQGPGGTSGGCRRDIPALLRAAAVAGADGFFLETHPDPDRAWSDSETQWPLAELPALLGPVLDLWHRAHAQPTLA